MAVTPAHPQPALTASCCERQKIVSTADRLITTQISKQKDAIGPLLPVCKVLMKGHFIIGLIISPSSISCLALVASSENMLQVFG